MASEKIKLFLKGVLPTMVHERLRNTMRFYRRWRWRASNVFNHDKEVGYERLVGDLHDLGVRPGKDLIVHSAMSKMGMVDGGAPTVIKALREVIGNESTLLMPAYPMKSSMLDTMKDPAPFSVAVDRSHMGKITEVFRNKEGIFRSGHPTHSIAALGPRAAQYTRDHHNSRSPCGPGSPFRMLSENYGWILCIGSGIGKVTSHHVIEDMVESYPIDVYLPNYYKKKIIHPDGRTEKVKVLVHDPVVAVRRIDKVIRKEREILAEMRKRGMVKEGLIGNASSYLFNANELDALLIELLKHGITIYTD
jgi:aminoglycoside 3-N-acetyltransferase